MTFINEIVTLTFGCVQTSQSWKKMTKIGCSKVTAADDFHGFLKIVGR
jgi:hypothetical protein